jgi:hypothetical protein
VNTTERSTSQRTTTQRAPHFALSALVLALLTACGGGGGGSDPAPVPPPPEPPAKVTFTGVVADGPLAGATVCYDINDNEACDADEPTSALTDVNGNYSFNVDPALAGKHAVLALVPATAIDKDTGAAIGAALKLKAPATATAGAQAVFVSPLTTAVADVAKSSGKTTADAAAQVKAELGLTASPLASFVGATDAGATQAALAARSVAAVMVDATKLATDAGVSAADANRFSRTLASSNLTTIAEALAQDTAAPVATRVTQAVAAVKDDYNLTAASAKAVAEATNKPAGAAGAPGPFLSLRRFAYTDANNYSYTLFTGDSSKTNAAGEFVANEVRKTQAAGADAPYNRNQMYWTGTAWVVCATQWEVSTTKLGTATAPQTGVYCGASRNETDIKNEDISGKTIREVLTSIRAHPLADSVGSHTNADGLPVNWGPDPTLVAATATFPAGSTLSRRRQLADIGGTDRVELTTKSTVLYADGRFRQATTLEQMGSMNGNLADPGVVPTVNNTVFVYDVAMANQPDATFEAFKRWRVGLDITNLKARFYACDVRKTDQAQINCAVTGNATLAISNQGSARMLRFATGYPAELTAKVKAQRQWAQHSGVVFRANRDLPTTRHDQRLNATAWDALRTALGIPAHTPAVAPAGPGPFTTLRDFTYTDANNYNWRTFTGDTSVLDASGQYTANEVRTNKAAGVLVPFVRNRLYWTGTTWYDCPSNGVGIIKASNTAPFASNFCSTYLDERTDSVTLTLDGRRMTDVVADIRSYGSKDGSFDYGNWGVVSTTPALTTAFFPAGSTMEYRSQLRKATPLSIATAATDKTRSSPTPTSSAAFDTWPLTVTLDELITKYPGDLLGNALNGNVALFVHSTTLATAPSADLTRTLEWRVGFDATGQKARIYTNNRTAVGNRSTNYVKVLDTTYTVETVGGKRVLRFAAMPDGFERDYFFTRSFAEHDGGVHYAFKDVVPTSPTYSIRLNRAASTALGTTLGVATD